MLTNEASEYALSPYRLIDIGEASQLACDEMATHLSSKACNTVPITSRHKSVLDDEDIVEIPAGHVRIVVT